MSDYLPDILLETKVKHSRYNYLTSDGQLKPKTCCKKIIALVVAEIAWFLLHHRFLQDIYDSRTVLSKRSFIDEGKV